MKNKILGIGAALLLYLPVSAFAALTPEISVRQQSDFTRVLFSWPEKVRFKVAPSGDKVTLEFSEAATLDTARIRSALGARLQAAQVTDNGRKLVLDFDQPYRIRHFISGNANGIDIMDADTPPPSPIVPPPEPIAEAKPPAPPPAPKPKPAVPEETAATPTVPLTQPAPAPEAPAAETPAPAEHEPIAEAAEPEATAAPEAPASQPNAPVPETTDPFAANEPEAAVKAELEAPEQIEIIEEEPAEPAPVAEVTETGGDYPFLVTTNLLPTMTEIRFPWRERVAAATFLRGDAIWIVFNKHKALNMTLLKSIMPASVLQVDEVAVPNHTVLRLTTDGTIFPKMVQPERSGEWHVVLSVYKQVPPVPLPIERRGLERDNPSLFIPTLQYAKPVTISDPVIGDAMRIAAVYTPGAGIYPARDYPQVHLPATAQGVVAIPKTDLLRFRTSRSGFIIDSKEGLALSKELPELKLAELEVLGGDDATWFPWDRWNPEPDSFMEARAKLQQAMVGSAGIRSTSLQLKLAELYLSEGLAAEALSFLNLIEEQDPGFFKERKLQAYRGAAKFLMDRYDEAKTAFSAEELASDDERKLWLDALKIFEESRPRFDYVDYYTRYIQYYPPALRDKLAIVAADNYINRKSYSRAMTTLETIGALEETDERMPYIDFLIGKIAQKKGQIKTAQEIWEPLTKQDKDRFVRARAEFALVTMLLDEELIDREEAIERLDTLRVVWRGDSLEMNLLNYLGSLYMQEERYIEGLRAWNELIEQFPTAEVAPDIAREMASIFKQLFSKGEADKLTPLEALALFYEFKRLIPIGEEGDVMVQDLADRLAKVDLLHRAAELLEHQIAFRQDKQARSKLGSRLAMIYLLNGEPKKSLETLEVTNYGENPAELRQRRQRIAAMAFASTGEPQRGVDMLEGDPSREAQLVRLNLYWQMREWRNVIRSGEALMGIRPDVTAPLTQQESEVMLQLAIAYMFERENDQLAYLRDVFGPLMPDGPNKEIFAFVTNTSGPVTPQQFSQVSDQISRMENFMQSYRDQVETGGLSSILN